MKTFFRKFCFAKKRNFQTFEEILKKEPISKNEVVELMNITGINDEKSLFLLSQYILNAYNNPKMRWTKEEDYLLLIRTSEINDILQMDTFEANLLALQVSFHLHEGEKMKLIYEKAIQKKKLHEIEPKDLYLLLMIAPHLGKWSDVVKFSKKILEIEPKFLNYIQENVETQKNSFLYSQIIRYCNEEKFDLNIIPKYEIFEFVKFELLHTHLLETNSDGSGEHEISPNESEDNWFLVDHEIPKLIVYGGCVSWYQLNGSIHLSGIQKEMNEIKLRGKGEYHDDTTHSYFNSEYEFHRVKDNVYQGVHKRGVITRVVEQGEMKSSSTFKVRFELKESLI